MDRCAFVHGSSVGQTVYIPQGAPQQVCNYIADNYFRGRSLRIKESSQKYVLFVELIKDSSGTLYCSYSFVNNDCQGSNERDGQYFAITILSNAYVLPEYVFKMLSSAYRQMYNSGKILVKDDYCKDRFTLSQFEQQKEYLDAFLTKVEVAFKQLIAINNELTGNTADYASWKGSKVALEICNSSYALNKLSIDGRIFISDEYETPQMCINQLEEKISELEDEIQRINQQHSKNYGSNERKLLEEIDKLNQEISGKETEILALNKKIEGFEITLSVVQREIDKYAKRSRQIQENLDTRDKNSKEGKKDLLKIILLMVILILTTISSLMNYAFFRNIPLISERITQMSEIIMGGETGDQAQHSSTTLPSSSFIVTPTNLTFDYNGGETEIVITASDSWNCNVECDWLTCDRPDDKTLLIRATKNNNSTERKYIFMISSGNNEKQICVTQGKLENSVCPNYKFIVTDAQGNVIHESDSLIQNQIISATVDNPNLSSDPNIGWKYSNCKGTPNNEKSKNITVTGIPGSKVVFSYGDKTNTELRKRFTLYVKKSNN